MPKGCGESGWTGQTGRETLLVKTASSELILEGSEGIFTLKVSRPIPSRMLPLESCCHKKISHIEREGREIPA